MKKNTIVLILVVLLIGGYAAYSYFSTSTMELTNTVEENSFSVDMPKAFEYSSENAYLSENRSMYLEWRYYTNEFDLDAQAMLYNVASSEFLKDDSLSYEQVDIGGIEAWQVEYRTLSTGLDGIHYYYSGVMTAIELDNEFLIFDAYQSMSEADGINSEISDADMQLLKDITRTIKIIDSSYVNVNATPASKSFSKVNLNLTSNWEVSEEGENGQYDFGYYSSYQLNDMRFWIDANEYTDEEANDVEYAKETIEVQSGYTLLGEQAIGGEAGYAFAYNAQRSDNDAPYSYGVFAVTEHYYVDVYFYTYEDDYTLTDEAIAAFVELISNIQ